MDQKEAMEALEHLRHNIQRYRSITKETFVGENGLTEESLAETWPWVFGSKCPLVQIQKCLDRGSVTGMEFYNFMTILDRFMPEVAVAGDFVFPKPTPDLIGALGPF
jgi:hypothetical protein